MSNPTGKFIEKVELNKIHIGSKVTYIPRHARMSDPSDANGRAYDSNGPTNAEYAAMNAAHPDSEEGRIKSWNNDGVFVDYVRNTARTNFEDLVWG